MNLLNIILAANQAADGTQQSQGGFWIMMILLFVVMWLFMIRPQQKKQKELENQRKQMKAGDRIVTAGGIHGKIEKVQDDTMTIEIAKGVSIKIDKSSVFAEVQSEAKKQDKKEEKPAKEEVKEEKEA